MSTFREPTNELPGWASFRNDESILVITDPGAADSESVWLYTYEAEALLAVLLDICPNAHAIAGSRLNSTLCNVAHWIERGCDPLQAARELRLLADGKTP